MSQSEQKIVQYLNEAHATEVGLVRVLAVADRDDAARHATARGSEKHLRETEAHAERVQARLGELAPRAAIRCWPASGSWRRR